MNRKPVKTIVSKLIAFIILICLCICNYSPFTSFANETPKAVTESDFSIINPVGGLNTVSVEALSAEDEHRILADNSVITVKMEDQKADASFQAPMLFSPAPVNNLDGHSSFIYETLSDDEKELYDALASTMEEYESSDDYLEKDYSASAISSLVIACVEIAPDISTDNLKNAYFGFLMDNCQYFYMHSVVYVIDDLLAILVNPSYISHTTRSIADEIIHEEASCYVSYLTEIKRQAAEGYEDYEVALALHDLLIRDVDYTYTNGRPCKEGYAHNIAGIFTGEGAVCEGYAKTFSYILNLMDIENLIVTGTAGNPAEGHAFNAIKLNDKYYFVDVTWDDYNNSYDYTNTQSGIGDYKYFCMPSGLFEKDHHIGSNSGSAQWCYTLPAFANDSDYTYAAKKNIIHYKSVIQRPSPNRNLKITNLTMSASEETIKTGERTKIEIHYDRPENSEDLILYSIDNSNIARLKVSGDRVIVHGLKNGKVRITGTNAFGGTNAYVDITVGTGNPNDNPSDDDSLMVEDVIWANGTKNYKTITVKPTIKASNYTDAKGKTKKGKLLFLAMANRTIPSFDLSKHKLLTKSDAKDIATISSKGQLTAKGKGKVFVYICDTGSCEYEEIEYYINLAPKKLFLTNRPGFAEKEDLLRKTAINVCDDAGIVYIFPYAGENERVSDSEYTVEFSKSSMSQYLEVSNIDKDADSNYYFTVQGLKAAANKAAKVKLIIKNEKSGKKATLNVTVYNEVMAAWADYTDGYDFEKAFEKKKDRLTLNLIIDTGCYDEDDNPLPTTDKLKLLVTTNQPSIDGKKVSASKSEEVKGTLSRNLKTFTLTATKDITDTSFVYLISTNNITKSAEAHLLATITPEGIILN